MIREVRAVLLLLLGNAILRLAITGDHVDYVKPEMRIPLLIGGGAMALLGLARLIELLRPRPSLVPAGSVGAADHDHGHGGRHGHDHGPRIAWLLVLPVFAILLVAPPPLGSYSAARESGTVAKPGVAEFPALPPGQTTSLSLAEYSVRAVWDYGRTLDDRTIQLTGFVTPGQGDEWFLTRMTLVCCAADADAIKIAIRGANAPEADTWVQVTGRYSPSPEPDPEKAVPVFLAAETTPTAVPAETYE